MPEIPKKPMEGDGPIDPAEPVTPIAGAAEEAVPNAPKGLPVAAKEPATKDVVADTAMVAPVVVVPEPAAVVAATEGDEAHSSSDDTAGEEASAGDSVDALGELSGAVHDDLEWTADLLERFG